MVKAYVLSGLGIGCHKEVAHAFELAGADAEIIHIRELLSGSKKLDEAQILNMTGGFLQADILGAGMCAANELEHASPNGDGEKRLKDMLIDYADRGNIIWGQCNGFQLLVRTGLLPGIDDDYSQQVVTLTGNACGNYHVAFLYHGIENERKHYMFEGLDNRFLYLWCRHGEGNMQFHSEYGVVSAEQANDVRRTVNSNHVLLRYCDPYTQRPAPTGVHNPNGSADSIAGLVNENGNIIGHMAHTEVGIYLSRDPRFFKWKDELRRAGVAAKDINMEGECLRIYRNIVDHVR